MTIGVPDIGMKGAIGYKVPRKKHPPTLVLRIVPLSMVVIVEFVGTLVMVADIDYRYPYGMFLAGSFVSAMCFFGFLGLRASPAGRASSQILGISTTLIALLYATVVVISHHGDDRAQLAPYVGLGFVLPAVVLAAYLYLALRSSGQLPPPFVQDGSIEGPSAPEPSHLFDARGIALASLLSSIVPVSISLYIFTILAAVGGVPLCCPAPLLIAALYLGIAALSKGSGLFWTVVATLAIILFGCITLLVGIDAGEEFITFLGILVLTYGLVAAETIIIDAWMSHRRFMYG